MIQNIAGLGNLTVDYSYDMLGNVLTVDYQKGSSAERFTHHYAYDGSKRLTTVTTTTDPAAVPTQQAAYSYYQQGPLKRLELGTKLQGLDYLYTLQGWLKGINYSNAAKDPGKDGSGNGFAPDAFGLGIEHFPGDYVNAASGITASITSGYPSSYNGTISGVSWFSNKTTSSNLGSAPNMFWYQYDEKYQLQHAVYGSPAFATNTFSEQSGVNKEFNIC